MQFINSPRVILILIISLLAACSSSPAKKSSKKSGTDAAVVEGSILPPGPVTPNPYLQDTPSVSKAISGQFAAAQAAMRNQQWSQAENILLKIISANDKLSGAHLNLANVYAAQKEKDKAETSYQMAITVNPKNLDAYNQFAIFKREQGEFAGAENLYKQAITVWPFHANSHKNIAILYDLYMGKSEQALPHYEAYFQLVGDDKQAASWIADLQRRLGIQPKPKPKPAAAPAETTEEMSVEATDPEVTESTETEAETVEEEVTE
jgi:tetratricopeptide (TPR) repeat protein